MKSVRYISVTICLLLGSGCGAPAVNVDSFRNVDSLISEAKAIAGGNIALRKLAEQLMRDPGSETFSGILSMTAAEAQAKADIVALLLRHPNLSVRMEAIASLYALKDKFIVPRLAGLLDEMTGETVSSETVRHFSDEGSMEFKRYSYQFSVLWTLALHIKAPCPISFDLDNGMLPVIQAAREWWEQNKKNPEVNTFLER